MRRKHWIIGISIAAVSFLAILCVVLAVPWFRHTGQLGDEIYYRYNINSGTLVIYGEGEMWDFYDPNAMGYRLEGAFSSPFHSSEAFSEDTAPLKKIIVLEGVTAITSHAFYGCANLEEVWIPASVQRIGDLSFNECPNLRRIYFSGDRPGMSVSAAFCKTIRACAAGEADSLTNHHITVIHQPGTTGYGGYGWGGIEAILEQNFLPGWARALWPW